MLFVIEKVGQREKRKTSGPVRYDESPLRENEAEVGVKKSKPIKTGLRFILRGEIRPTCEQ